MTIEECHRQTLVIVENFRTRPYDDVHSPENLVTVNCDSVVAVAGMANGGDGSLLFVFSGVFQRVHYGRRGSSVIAIAVGLSCSPWSWVLCAFHGRRDRPAVGLWPSPSRD